MSLKDRVLAILPGPKRTSKNDRIGEAKDGFGLHKIYDGSFAETEAIFQGYLEAEPTCLEPVDIIAVHGLGGGCYSSWRHPETRKVWLQDFVPSAMPSSRVFSYGYDANIKNRSTLHMMDDASNLLLEISTVRSSDKLQSRPIVFIGHSLGGILIKKALIMAREEKRYQNIPHSTSGIMFMGTPHDGADAAKLASILANIANSVTALNTDIIETLKWDSVPLQEISRSFGFLTEPKIVTAIEGAETQIPYTKAYTLVVPPSSARLNLGERETQLSIVGADHHMVCKFADKDEIQYKNKIRSALISLAKAPIVEVSSLREIPYSPDPSFAGRDGIIKNLHKAFSVQDKHTRIALYGLGGIGKSGIALEFAHKFAAPKPQLHIFWVRGAKAQHFEQSYRSIAKSLRLDGYDDPAANVLDLVKEWMMRTTTPWLMILDNANDPSLYFPVSGAPSSDPNTSNSPATETSRALASFIPQASNGCVLITSRDRMTALQLVGNQSKNIFKIEQLSPDESLTVVRSRLSENKYTDEELSTFASTLGHIPLALTQACAYIEANETMTVSEYCKLFHEDKDKELYLLCKESFDMRREDEMSSAVIKTWHISFEYLKAHNCLTSNLLSFLGVLDRQHIPKILAYAIDGDKLKVDEALNQLLAFCLVRLESNNKYFELHELVETAVYAWLKQSDTLRGWLGSAMVFFHEMFSDLIENVQRWPLLNLLLPHVQQVINTSWTIPELKTTLLAGLCNLFALYLSTQYRVEEAKSFHERAVDLDLYNREPDVSTTLLYRCGLAINLMNQSRLVDAKLTLQQVQERLKHCAPPSRDMLKHIVSLNLAQLLAREGKIEESEAMQEEAYKDAVKIYGEDHEESLHMQGYLALARGRCGKTDEAVALSLNVVEKQLNLVGSANITTRSNMTVLVSSLRLLGKFDDAKHWVEFLMKTEEDALPTGHPDKLRTARLLASLLRCQKDFVSAENVLRQALSDGEAFAQNNYSLGDLKVELAQVIHNQGRSLEAKQIILDVLKSKEPLAICPNGRTCEILQTLSNIHSDLHEKEEAENLQWQILEHFVDMDRSNTEELSIHAKRAFVSIIRILELDEALTVEVWCDEILTLQDVQSIGGPTVFQNRVRILSIFLMKLGCYVEGVELQLRWRDKDDNHGLYLIRMLAQLYLDQERNAEAQAILDPLVQDARRILGPSHELTLSSMGFLAAAIGTYTDEGARVLRAVIEAAEDNSVFALAAWHNLGIGYERRSMDREALDAFYKANELASKYFKEDDPAAIQVRENYEKSLSNHRSVDGTSGLQQIDSTAPLDQQEAKDDQNTHSTDELDQNEPIPADDKDQE